MEQKKIDYESYEQFNTRFMMGHFQSSYGEAFCKTFNINDDVLNNASDVNQCIGYIMNHYVSF